MLNQHKHLRAPLPRSNQTTTGTYVHVHGGGRFDFSFWFHVSSMLLCEFHSTVSHSGTTVVHPGTRWRAYTMLLYGEGLNVKSSRYAMKAGQSLVTV